MINTLFPLSTAAALDEDDFDSLDSLFWPRDRVFCFRDPLALGTRFCLALSPRADDPPPLLTFFLPGPAAEERSRFPENSVRELVGTECCELTGPDTISYFALCPLFLLPFPFLAKLFGDSGLGLCKFLLELHACLLSSPEDADFGLVSVISE